MAFLNDVMVDEIGNEARRIEPAAVAGKVGRLFLTVVAAILYSAGWTVRKAFVVTWLAATWSWTAIRLGWREAAPKPRT